MPLNWPPAGAGDVASYQLSAIPFVTSSAANEVGTSTPIKVKFDHATRFIVVHASGSKDLRVGFTHNGVLGKGGVSGSTDAQNGQNANYFVVKAGETTPRIEVRCKELHFLSVTATTGFSLMAGLTPIRNRDFPLLSGSNGFKGVG